MPVAPETAPSLAAAGTAPVLLPAALPPTPNPEYAAAEAIAATPAPPNVAAAPHDALELAIPRPKVAGGARGGVGRAGNDQDGGAEASGSAEKVAVQSWPAAPTPLLTDDTTELEPVAAKPNKPLTLLLLLLTPNPSNSMGCAAFKDAAASTEPKLDHAPPWPKVFSEEGAANALL